MIDKIETLPVGPLDVNCYIAGCDEHKVCAVIDPGDSSDRIYTTASNRGWKITHIINTHAHADHTGANKKLKELTGAAIFLHEADKELVNHPSMADMAQYLGLGIAPTPDELVKDGGRIKVCPCVEFEIIHTPGHTPGGICLLCGNVLFSGDTLFHMSIGRADLPGGNMAALLDSIKTRLFPLPLDVKVYPGHGDATSIGLEKNINPFLVGASY